MASHTGSRITQNNLVLNLDTKNNRSVPIIHADNDHGRSEWYCVEGGTAFYALPYGGTIYENDNGAITTMATATGPSRGTFLCTASRFYHCDKPFHIMDNDQHHKLIPISLSGTKFLNYANRYADITYYFYSPYGDATVNVYDNVSGGASGTASSTVSVSINGQNTYVTSTTNALVVFTSDIPIIMSTRGQSGDRSIIPPASTQVYRRRNQYEYNINWGAPSVANDTYYISDTTPCMANAIGDGSGGDNEFGLALENLSEFHAFGDQLSDYWIVAPYPNTTVKVSYWQSNRWIEGETHTFNGSLESPDNAFREGTTGFGSAGNTADDDGTANYFNSSTLWKWEGNNPYYVVVNDTANDEETLYGWSKGRKVLKNYNRWKDLTNQTYTNPLSFKNMSYSDADSDGISFNGTDQHILMPSILNPNFSVEALVYLTDSSTGQGIYGDGSYFRLHIGGGNFKWWVRQENLGAITYEITTPVPSTNAWYHLVGTAESNGSIKLYLNGIEKSSTNSSVAFGGSSSGNATIGNTYSTSTSYLNGKIQILRHYDKALSSLEITRNFNGIRSRYSL